MSERAPAGRPRQAVFLTYDGLEDPLGQSQVMPYLRGLADRGHHVHVVSFEKAPHRLRRAELIADRIRWTALRYHRTPTVPATALDMATGLATAGLMSVLDGADVLHARALVPAAMALPLARARDLPLIFDTRALWADEKVDLGHWPRDGRLHRGAKRVERQVLRDASAVTVLTNAFQRYLRQDYPHREEVTAPVVVIPTCTDLGVFRPDVPPDPSLSAELSGHRVLGFLGALRSIYLPAEMIRFYLAWRRASAPATSRLLLISLDDPETLRALLRPHGLEHELVHRRADRSQVAGMLRCSHASVCFNQHAFSKLAAAPTKLGEVLGCGLPVAANATGDVGALLQGARVGVSLDDFSDTSLDAAAARLSALSLDPTVAPEARELATRWFSLDRGVDAYDRLYRSLRRPGEPGARLPDRAWP